MFVFKMKKCANLNKKVFSLSIQFSVTVFRLLPSIGFATHGAVSGLPTFSNTRLSEKQYR